MSIPVSPDHAVDAYQEDMHVTLATDELSERAQLLCQGQQHFVFVIDRV